MVELLWSIEIVCTDRGQHKRTWITRMRLDRRDDGSEGWSSPITDGKHSMYGPPDADAEPGDMISRESYGFACCRCTRHPKIRRDRWKALMDGARRVGLEEFDVSALD